MHGATMIGHVGYMYTGCKAAGSSYQDGILVGIFLGRD